MIVEEILLIAFEDNLEDVEHMCLPAFCLDEFNEHIDILLIDMMVEQLRVALKDSADEANLPKIILEILYEEREVLLHNRLIISILRREAEEKLEDELEESYQMRLLISRIVHVENERVEVVHAFSQE